MNFMVLHSRKRSIFVIDSYLNDSVFTAVKRDAKSQTRYVKGVPSAGIRKEYLFREKWYTKGQGVGPRGGASLYKNLLSTPPPPVLTKELNAR